MEKQQNSGDLPPAGFPAPPVTGWHRLLLLLVGLHVAGLILGSVLTPALLRLDPLIMIGLNPRLRWLLLAAPATDFWPFVLTGTLRRTLGCIAFYATGVYFGERALHWFEQRFTRSGRFLRRLEALFLRWKITVIILLPVTPVALLAGSTAVSPWLWFPITLAGIAARMVLVYELGDWMSPLVLPVNRFLMDWYPELTGILVLWFLYSWLRKRGRRRKQREPSPPGGRA